MNLGWAHALLFLVVLQRLGEVFYARRNTLALMQRGAKETGASHYPLFIVLHTAWLAAMFAFTRPNPHPWWSLLVLFGALQLGRLWVMASLGPYWTTRIITLKGVPPVTTGPYRYLRHPNYLIVALELPTLPLALGMPWVAAIFGVLNLALLGYHIRVEDEARRDLG